MWLEGGGIGRRSLPFECGVPVPRIAAPGPAQRDLADARGTRTTYSNKSIARSTKLAALAGFVIEASAWV